MYVLNKSTLNYLLNRSLGRLHTKCQLVPICSYMKYLLNIIVQHERPQHFLVIRCDQINFNHNNYVSACLLSKLIYSGANVGQMNRFLWFQVILFTKLFNYRLYGGIYNTFSVGFSPFVLSLERCLFLCKIGAYISNVDFHIKIRYLLIFS